MIIFKNRELYSFLSILNYSNFLSIDKFTHILQQRMLHTKYLQKNVQQIFIVSVLYIIYVLGKLRIMGKSAN